MSGVDPSDVSVRQARAADLDAVAAFTRETWADRDSEDYIPRVFEQWVETDGPTQRTFVLDVNDGEDVAGVCQGTLLSDWEGWAQGMRVNPEYRGLGVSKKLSNAIFEWARDAGAVVVRNMVFSWNVAGLGQSRAVGFEPCAEFRFARPEPDADAEPALDIGADAAGAWSFWTGSDARTDLRGLAMDPEESWALSELTRERLAAAAEEDRLLTVADGGVVGFAVRAYTFERENDAGETVTWALYAVGAWSTPEAARALYCAVARDAASVDAAETRVAIPESVRWVSDTAFARVPVADEPDFVMTADLTDPTVGSR